MKTKMIKRTLSTMLASTMALSLYAAMPAFAAEIGETETNEPRTYLYYQDFENDEIGSAPSNVYKYVDRKIYSEAKKELITTDYAKVVQDGTTTNTSRYLDFKPTSNNYKFIQMYLGEDGSKYNKGTVVFEYDGWIDLDGKPINNCKYLSLGVRGEKDGEEIKAPYKIDIMNYLGEDSSVPEEEKDSSHLLKRIVEEEAGKAKDSVIKSNGKDYIFKRDNAQWHNYKIEVNLENGDCRLWLDGKVSETWKNLYVNHNIGTKRDWGTRLLDSLVLGSDYKVGDAIASTPWKIDNIKVYFKDTAETSPFGNITSEKNGKVNIDFGYAVNAEDISIYNADGEKINGTFEMSNDNKKATFTPDRIEEDGLYYVKLAKLASGTVTPQTTKEFDYAPGRTNMVISGLESVVGTIAPTFTLTHTDGVEKDVMMILAAYKDGKLVKADVKTQSLTTEDKNDVQIAKAPTFNLLEDEADTVKAFAWIGGTNVPICNAVLYPADNQ